MTRANGGTEEFSTQPTSIMRARAAATGPVWLRALYSVKDIGFPIIAAIGISYFAWVVYTNGREDRKQATEDRQQIVQIVDRNTDAITEQTRAFKSMKETFSVKQDITNDRLRMLVERIR